MTQLRARDFAIGQRVETAFYNLHGRRILQAGTVKGYAGEEVSVTWDGNDIGATQNVSPGRLLRLWPVLTAGAPPLVIDQDSRWWSQH